MKVHLPDGTELELEDGATGLDCARAIGERLAKVTAAIEVDGEVRDLRLPGYARAVTSRGVYNTVAGVAVVPVSCGGVMLSRT